MHRVRALLLLLLTATVGLGVSTGSAAARGNVLPAATYDALTAGNDALIDAAGDPAIRSERQLFSAYRSACRLYTTGEPLLVANRDQCFASVAAMELLIRECKAKQSCLRLWKRADAAFARLYDLLVATNRVVDQTVAAGACRTALRASPAELRHAREGSRLQTDAFRANLAKDKRALAALRKRAKRLDKLKVRTAEQIQDAITDHC
jgi:hypothetical protein